MARKSKGKAASVPRKVPAGRKANGAELAARLVPWVMGIPPRSRADLCTVAVFLEAFGQVGVVGRARGKRATLNALEEVDKRLTQALDAARSIQAAGIPDTISAIEAALAEARGAAKVIRAEQAYLPHSRDPKPSTGAAEALKDRDFTPAEITAVLAHLGILESASETSDAVRVSLARGRRRA